MATVTINSWIIARSDKHPITNPNGHAILKWWVFIEASFGLNVFSVCNFGQFGFSNGNYLLFFVHMVSRTPGEIQNQICS